MSIKLSKRLMALKHAVQDHDRGYAHVWDTGCDHGYLGAALLTQSTDYSVHFVDIASDIIAPLQTKLKTYYPHANWDCHVDDLRSLPLEKYTGKHLVICAGVGGELICEAIQQFANQPADLLLCPVHHTYKVRQALITHGYKLVKEQLVCENKRFYEVLMVSNQEPELLPVSPVGDDIWQHALAQQYLAKLIKHYQRSAHTDKQVLNAYNAVQLTVNQTGHC